MEGVSDFQFYLRFTKPLVLSLPKPKDRALAASWIKKLMTIAAPEELKGQYLQLLLFVLQRKRLGGIFLEDPNTITTLEPFKEKNLIDVARKLVEQENVDRIREEGPFPPIISDYSPDLLEYVAVQQIPNFGVHAYYAIGRDSLMKWDRFDKAILPKITDSMVTITNGDEGPTGLPGPQGKPSSTRRERFNVEPPVTPLGVVVNEDEEDRLPPTWGSNLVGVQDDRIKDPQTMKNQDSSDMFGEISSELKVYKDIIEEFKTLDDGAGETASGITESPPCRAPCAQVIKQPPKTKDKEVSLIFDRAMSATLRKSRGGSPSIMQKKRPSQEVCPPCPPPVISSQDQFAEKELSQIERLSAIFEAASQSTIEEPTVTSQSLQGGPCKYCKSDDNLEDVALRKTRLQSTSPAISAYHPITIPKPSVHPKRPCLTPATPRLEDQSFLGPCGTPGCSRNRQKPSF